MRVGGAPLVRSAVVTLLWCQAALPGSFPDCNDNGVDDTLETATTFGEVFVADVSYSSQLADLDADGDLDLLRTATPGWRENLDGSGNFGPNIPIGSVGGGDTLAGDLDADGDLDLVLRTEQFYEGWTPGILVYENLGAATFDTPIQWVYWMPNDSGCFSEWWGQRWGLADRDSDGDLDIFSGALNCSVAAVVTVRNDGTGDSWQGTWFPNSGYVLEPAVADVDGDADNDLIISDFAGQIQWFEGPSDAPVHDLFTPAPIDDLLVGDLDGDGDPDIVGVRDRPYEDADDIAVYENASGLGNFVESQVIVPMITFPIRITLADLDGSGDTDLAWIDDSGLWWHANTYGTFGAPQLVSGNTGDQVLSIDSGDIDGDGDTDLVVAVAQVDQVFWYRNEGNDCNGNRVPDECEPDCNLNGITDACDIRHGTSVDCDGNGTPDECDTGCTGDSCDHDGDGCQDGVDEAPQDATACGDTDADGCDDCFSGVFDPATDGANGDSDGVCDLTDCDPFNNEVWDEPDAATGLMLAREGAVAALSWNRPLAAGGIFPRYDVLRSSSASDFLSMATTVCVESDDGDESASDADVPASSEVFHYLVRVENDCPGGSGTMGTDSSGAPRTGLSCVPVPSGDGLVLNEVNYTVGPNDPGQFIEVLNPSDQPVDLSNLALIMVNKFGAETLRVSLAPAGVLSPDGFLVVAAPSVIVDPGASVILLPGENSVPSLGGIALFDLGATSLVDALSYEVAITEATFDGVAGTWNLVEGALTPWADNDTEDGAMIRFPDGLDTDVAASDWGVAGPPTGSPTPGSANATPW